MDVSVVIPCHDITAWQRILRAVDSVEAQTRPAQTIVLAVDHNLDLTTRLRSQRPDLVIAPNDTGSRGAGGTRNVGAIARDCDVIAFLDDDETAEPEWLARLLAPLSDPTVVGTGGRYTPAWLEGRPAWFPDELAWAVGAHHSGMPSHAAPVRNVWSGNLAVRRPVFDAVHGFRADFGKRGVRSRPEDTDFCIRAARAYGGHWVYVPDAVIHHDVPAERSTFRFFVRRSYAEGRGKIELRDLLALDDDTHGISRAPSEALRTERNYLLKTVPAGFVSHLLRRRFRAAAAIVIAVAAAGWGAALAQVVGRS